jgi:Signal transduction histidine kinase.
VATKTEGTLHGSVLNADETAWLHQVMSEGQLLADLAFADIVFWVRQTDESYVAVGHSRPSSSATLFYRDVVGTAPRPEWEALIAKADTTRQIVDSAKPDWYESTPARCALLKP